MSPPEQDKPETLGSEVANLGVMRPRLIYLAAILLTLAVALALMSLVVIPREERYLAARFPDEYPPYKDAVRRWL